MNFIDVDIAKLGVLKNKQYAIIGTGGYSKKLLQHIEKNNVTLPRCFCYIGENTPNHNNLSLPLIELNTAKHIKYFVIGSNVFQFEIIEKARKILPDSVKYFDLSSELTNNISYYEHKITLQKPYILFYSVDPNNHKKWLSGFERYLKSHDIELIFKHPLQQTSHEVLKQSRGIFLWNGTTSSFNYLKEKLIHLNKKFTYAECGFFPQKDYVYFDRHGINDESSLQHGNVSWLPNNYLEIIAQHKTEYFLDNYPKLSYGEYVFVPLQLESDSNVRKNSRFKYGMQEFIEYICTLYDQPIIFKAHPLDTKTDKYVLPKGRWATSSETTHQLIHWSDIVHGINSTVLFEATLMGKKVIAEGLCLLNRFENKQRLLAAMILRQKKINDANFSREYLQQFTNLEVI
ncbi:hypothetical protein [Catenovulum sediminis]|uniref:capsular polysaccharide export protein, LipB/KpsS family n=1 Tax=Catenovulum sediminis TaxID=1740262 RepID=UPI0011807EF3|nr:hypothetical protein [Catenovulum sediminis]